jgi:hypothetical protein
MVAPNPWMILPFALLLVAIAIAPLLAPVWWSRHYAKVAFGLGAITLGYYIFILRDAGRALHTAHDYIGFITLIGSLFIVSGGIHSQPRPGFNEHCRGQAEPQKERPARTGMRFSLMVIVLG